MRGITDDPLAHPTRLDWSGVPCSAASVSNSLADDGVGHLQIEHRRPQSGPLRGDDHVEFQHCLIHRFLASDEPNTPSAIEGALL
jgi:hypothetical protein